MTRARFNIVFAAVGLAALAAAPYAQQQNFDNVEVHLQKAQGNVYMLVGAGGNVTVQAGPEGVLIVDTQYAPMSAKLLSAIRSVAGPLRYIIIRTATPTTWAATRISRRRARRSPAGTSRSTSATRRKAPRSSPTSTPTSTSA